MTDNKDKVGVDDCCVVKSPFPDFINTFNSDDDDSFSDLDFIIPGMEAVHLHRIILVQASAMLSNLMKMKQSAFGAYDKNAHTIQWMFDVCEVKPENDVDKTEVYHDILQKWLTFCCGENQTFETEKCAAALKESEGHEKIIEEYVKFVANKDAIKDVKLCFSLHQPPIS